MTEKELIQKGVDLTVNSMMKHFIEEIAELKRKHEIAIEILQAENQDLENENRGLRTENESLKVKNVEIIKRSKIEIKHLKRISSRKLKKAKKIFDDDFSEMLKDKESEITDINQKHLEDVEEIKEDHLEVVEAQKDHFDKLQNTLLIVIKQQQFAEKNERLMVEKNEKLMIDLKQNRISKFKDVIRKSGCHVAWSTALNSPDFQGASDTCVKVEGAAMKVYDFEFRKCTQCENSNSSYCDKKRGNLTPIPSRLGYRPSPRQKLHS